MKNKLKQNFFIELEIYPFDVMISVDESDDELRKTLQGYKIDSDEIENLMNMPETTRGRHVFFKSSHQTVVRLVSQPKRIEMEGVIIHEIFHVVTYIFKSIGMKLKLEVSDEAYAYLMQYLTEKIFTKIFPEK